MRNKILSHLPADFPWQVHWYEVLPSTNDLLKQWGKDGIAHGTVVIADQQSCGRGRMGRSFHSPAGCGIYLSVLLRPKCKAAQLMHLTCAVATAVCDGVEKCCGFRPGVKWINDLVAENKKLGGILTELGLDPKTGRVSYAVLGIGINCGQIESDFDESIRSMATSARMVLGRPADRDRLIAEMVKSLEKMDRELLSSPAAMLDRYRADCMTLGRQVSIVRGDEVRHATALDIDAEGGLIVRYDTGETAAVTSGEVSVRGLYGYL